MRAMKPHCIMAVLKQFSYGNTVHEKIHEKVYKQHQSDYPMTTKKRSKTLSAKCCAQRLVNSQLEHNVRTDQNCKLLYYKFKILSKTRSVILHKGQIIKFEFKK